MIVNFWYTILKKYNIESIFDDEILKYAQLHFYENEEYILESGEILEYYYLLVDGKIKVYYPFENGKSMTLKFYKDFNTKGIIKREITYSYWKSKRKVWKR